MKSKVPVTIEESRQGEPLFEAYGLLLASVLLGNNGKPPGIVAVTAAKEGDGATTTALNLALMMARTGRPTVLVDANLRGPMLHALLEIPQSPGLAELLMGRADLKQAAVQTRVPHLALIPAGQADVPAQALLTRSGIGDLLAVMRSRFDLVVVDTPAVLRYSDALHVSRHVDGVLQVVSSRGASRRDQQEARRLLDMVGARVLGAVMTQAPLRGYARQRRAW
ncbi:MAG: CpsD/CapB family tyrosine-protein kinase [Armatimonadota bacterium]|nr:CpsD/CapB family tyrosine-protein kinase [Armatimonadota bacterium]